MANKNIIKTESEYPIYMHVNYLEGIFPLEDIMSRCADAGYDGIELRGSDRNKLMGVEEYLEHTFKAAAKAGLKITYCGSNDAANADSDIRGASLEAMKKLISFAGANGIGTLNAFGSSILNPAVRYIEFDKNGSAYVNEEQWRRSVEYFQEVGDFVGQANVDVCLETHNGYLHDLGEPTAKFLNDINRQNIKANLDFGNMYLNKLNKGIAEELRPLTGKIGYVHLKNSCSFNDFGLDVFMSTPLCGGAINNFLLVRTLIESGYRGIITVENIMQGDKRCLMKEDRDYLKGLLDDILDEKRE